MDRHPRLRPQNSHLQQEVCSRPGALYKTNFESLFISYSGGFDMNTGKSSNIRHDDRNYCQMQINEND